MNLFYDTAAILDLQISHILAFECALADTFVT